MKNYFSLAVFILLLNIAAPASASGSFASSSVLADGRWLKVRVDSTGVQRISYDTLRQWGFSHPDKVAVYGYGSVESSMNLATAPDDLPAVRVSHTADALYFYAEGDLRVELTDVNSIKTYRNYYSYGSHYFLTEQAPAELMEVRESSFMPDTEAEPLTSHISVSYYEPEEYNPTRGSVFWYGQRTDPSESVSVDFNLTDHDGSGYVGYTLIAKNAVNPFLPRLTAGSNITLNGSGSTKINRSADAKDYYSAMSKPNVVPFTVQSGSSARFALGIPASEVDNTEFFALDAIWTLYNRRNIMRADSPELTMHFTTGGREASVTADEVSDLMLWDVTSPRQVAVITTSAVDADGSRHFMIPDSPAPVKLVAFDPQSSLLPTPALEGEVTNSNIHSLHGYDMVIVTSSAFMQAAERLASLHAEAQGMNVAIVDKAEVFNEFSSGSFTANSIRLMTKMLHERDGRLKYLLLLGGADFDNRSVASDFGPYLPSYQIEGVDNARNVAKSITCDLYFGSIEDDLYADMTTRSEPSTPRHIDVAVGRLPVMATGEADNVVDKISEYIRNPRRAGFINRALIMSDYGNRNQHMRAAESVASVLSEYMPALTLFKGYQNAFQFVNGVSSSLRRYTGASIAAAPGFIYYAGHSSQHNFFSDSFFDQTYAEKLRYSNNPLMFLAACFPYSFDYSFRGIATDMLLQRDGGPIAVIAPGREVYMTSNQIYSEVFAEVLLTSQKGETIGDIHRRSLNEILVSTLLHRTNALSYNLGGDPAIPMPRATYDAVITGGDMNPRLGRKARLEGEIRDLDGSFMSDFNGQLSVEFYNSSRTFRSFVNNSDDKEEETRMDLTVDDDLITTVTGKVTDGRWAVEFTLPDIPTSDAPCRISLMASPDKGFDFAIGGSSINIDEYDPALATSDTEAPQLDLVLDDALSLGSVAETTRYPSVTITVTDRESGVFNSRLAVSGKLCLRLDGNTLDNVSELLTSDGDGVYTITSFPLGKLNDGRHTLTASVADNAGNVASRSIDFVVVESAIDCEVVPESEIVSTSADFRLIHSSTSTPEMKIIVEDLAGNHIFSRNLTGDSFSWELRDDAGQPVDDGTYVVYAIVKSHPFFGSTGRRRFTVIR